MFQSIIADSFARGIIRRKVRQLISCSGFRDQDAEDLEQELLCRLLGSLQSFDESHPQHRNAFITTVVERSAGLIRRRQRRRRKYLGEVQSFDAARTDDSDGTESSLEAVDSHSQHAIEQSDLGLDLHTILAALPADLRELAGRLARQKLTEIARDLNIAEGTVRFRRDQIRDILAAARSRYFS